LVYWSQNDS